MLDGVQPAPARRLKFSDPDRTQSGAPRAEVAFRGLKTLWVNTGTLCNIACANCYIDSSPTNDRLAYFRLGDLRRYLDEIAASGAPTEDIGFTGGEPFLNPDLPAMAEEALSRGFRILILTNAMRPMMRPRVMTALCKLRAAYGARLTLRVSLDHYTQGVHDAERGAGAWAAALEGLDWLAGQGVRIAVAGRSLSGEPEAQARAGYARLFAQKGWPLRADDPHDLVLFPEMSPNADPPEISDACWDILGVSPADQMCASARMAVRRKGAAGPAVLACTLIADDPAFELGDSLAAAAGPVKLNHPFCATFCVLGGASCGGGA